MDLIFEMPRPSTDKPLQFSRTYILSYLENQPNILKPVENSYTILFMSDQGDYIEFDRGASILYITKGTLLKIKLILKTEDLITSIESKDTTLDKTKLTYNFAFSMRQKIRVIPFDTVGTIMGIYVCEDGIQYRVRYFYEGSIKTEYFYENELVS